jgi:enoyl-CoA hydratase
MPPLEGYQTLRFDRDGRVLTVTIDSGLPMNAVDGRMHEELARLFIDLQRDEDSDLIILTGAGKAFCAGGDAQWFGEMIAHPAKFRHIAPEAKRIITSLLDLEKPILCRLNGAAAGLGASIALLCDIIIADERALIGDPHVKVGLVAGDGGAIIWPQLVGFAKAKELLLTGDMVKATDAVAMGLINHAVPSDALDAKVAEIASKILGNPRWAVRWTKTITNIPLRTLAAQINDAAMGYEILSNMTQDRAEAVAAFREKRPARLTGE